MVRKCRKIANASGQYHPEPVGTGAACVFHRRDGLVLPKQRMNDLGKRIDDVKGSLDKRIDDLKSSMEKRFDDQKSLMDKRFKNMKDYVKSEFKRVEERIDRLEIPIARK
jgi:hypothetical protein